MREQIIKHLEGGGRIIVCGTWHFKGLEMECDENMELRDTGYCCCQDHYDSYEEAAQAVSQFADNDEDVELL